MSDIFVPVTLNNAELTALSKDASSIVPFALLKNIPHLLNMENRNPHPSGNWARRDRGRNKGCVESWEGFKEEAGNTKIAECEGGYD